VQEVFKIQNTSFRCCHCSLNIILPFPVETGFVATWLKGFGGTASLIVLGALKGFAFHKISRDSTERIISVLAQDRGVSGSAEKPLTYSELLAHHPKSWERIKHVIEEEPTNGGSKESAKASFKAVEHSLTKLNESNRGSTATILRHGSSFPATSKGNAESRLRLQLLLPRSSSSEDSNNVHDPFAIPEQSPEPRQDSSDTSNCDSETTCANNSVVVQDGAQVFVGVPPPAHASCCIIL